MLKLAVVEHAQALVDYSVTGNIVDEESQRDLFQLGDLEPYLHDLALRVIRKFKAKVIEVKKRRFVTFKNVDQDHAMIFSELEIKRILENLRVEEHLEIEAK